MYILPICITAYKIFEPFFSPSLNTLVIVPYITGDFHYFHQNVPPDQQVVQAMHLKIQDSTMVQNFEKLLQLNNYEITDTSDKRAIIWCDKGSDHGKTSNYHRKIMKYKTRDGKIVDADHELNKFVQNHKTTSAGQATDIILKGPHQKCFKKIVESRNGIKLSELSGQICNHHTILALMEAGWLKAEGKYSSMSAEKNVALHSIILDKPLDLLKYVDFGGLDTGNGIIRLIGYQGELRLLQTRGKFNELFDVFNKFGAGNIDANLLSEFRNMYLNQNNHVKYSRHLGKRLRLGGFYINAK